jgi:hypothetical protein
MPEESEVQIKLRKRLMKQFMNNSNLDYAGELAVLKKKYKLLMRTMCGFIGLWMITLIGQSLNAVQASNNDETKNKASVQTQQTLQVHELVVVDKNGTPRVRIAGNHTDPVMLGKRSKRHSEAAGVMLYDAEGNERGGYVTGQRSIALTMDEINRAAMHLSVDDKGEMGFSLDNGIGGTIAMGIIPTGPWLQFHTPGKPIVSLPNFQEGQKK